MPDLPAGTVTFLFTDIEGSTARWEAHREAMALALTRHDALLREAIQARGGHIFKTIGDAFQAAFSDPLDAILAAARRQPARAARLFGAAETLIDRCGGVLEPVDGADWDHHLAAARAQLDGPAWDAAWAEGMAMTEDEAVAYVRGEIDPWAEDGAAAR